MDLNKGDAKVKIYAIKAIAWIEDHYKTDNIVEGFLFLSKESAENKLAEIEISETNYKFIEIEKEGIQYLVCYDDFLFGDVDEENAEKRLWGSTGTCWYYIKELEVQ